MPRPQERRHATRCTDCPGLDHEVTAFLTCPLKKFARQISGRPWPLPFLIRFHGKIRPTKIADLSMEDYRTLGAMEAIDVVTRLTGTQQVNAVGYCLGGTLLSIAAATMARNDDRRLASLTLLASQVDFKEPGELSLFIDESQVSFLEAIMWKHGYLNTTQRAGALKLLNTNDLIWSHRLNQYLLGLPDQRSDLMAWNADATRMPYRMHSEYLRQLFLPKRPCGRSRYRTDGLPIALSDIHIPVFAVGTVTDHIAPWRSVFKIHLLTDTAVTFLLTSGGHNAGVVSPPGHPNRNYQIAERAHDSPYVDADTWQKTIPLHDGSWWPAWQSWLAARSGRRFKPPTIDNPLHPTPQGHMYYSHEAQYRLEQISAIAI